jgi:hypothetical protein
MQCVINAVHIFFKKKKGKLFTISIMFEPRANHV